MKYYRMLIEKDGKPESRKTYTSPRQGSAPHGWKCIAVIGYHEKPGKRTEGENG